jgi:hypothetical protein
MAHLTKELSQAAAFRKSSIDAMRDATQATLAACAEMRGDMVRDYRSEMQKFLAALSRDVAAHRRAMAHQIAQTQKQLAATAKNMAAHRNATMNEIAHLASARARAASRMRSGLAHQVHDIAMKTAQLRDAAGATVLQLANAHRKMAKQQSADLKAGRRKLHTATTKFVDGMHAERMKTHEIWSDFKHGKAA